MAVLEELAWLGCGAVVFGGGEPLLSPNLIPLVLRTRALDWNLASAQTAVSSHLKLPVSWAVHGRF